MFAIEYYKTDTDKIPVYNLINVLPLKLRIKAFKIFITNKIKGAVKKVHQIANTSYI